MYEIHQETIEFELSKINNLIPIKINDGLNCTTTVWLIKIDRHVYWATNLFGVRYKIFPSKSIQILKIGGREVQSVSSYKKERSIYYETLKEQKHNIFKQAYQHKKQLN